MNVEQIRTYCISKQETIECFPFDAETLVLKVMNKMFALVNLDGELSLSLKCDPKKAIELRERYPCVKPGYHMNKNHWNTIKIDGSVSDKLIFQWIDDSYNLVISKLPKSVRAVLMNG